MGYWNKLFNNIQIYRDAPLECITVTLKEADIWSVILSVIKFKQGFYVKK